MREGDIHNVSADQDEVTLWVAAAPVPGIEPKLGSANIRMTIEEALELVDSLKNSITQALKHR